MSAIQLPAYRPLASTFYPILRASHTAVLLLAAGVLSLSPRPLSAQTVSYSGTAVNFGTINICPAGQTTPAPCSETMTLTFMVTASGTLGTPKALTLGAPNLDFTLASGSTCTGSVIEGNSCTVNVTFAPRFAGLGRGGVEVVDGSGSVLADVPVYGIGSGPQVTFHPGTLSTLGSGFTDPSGVAVDGSGNVFFATGGNLGGGVYELLAAGGYNTVKTLATANNGPQGVALDGSGNLFVATGFNGRVEEFLATGGYTTVKTVGPPIGDYFPFAVAVDGSGNLFVAGGATYPDVAGGVYEILAAGGYTTVNALGSGFDYPEGVAVGASGNVFVADSDNYAVKEILAAGGYATVITLTSVSGNPYGVAVDGSGNVFFTQTNSDSILKLDYADPPSVVFPTPTAVGTTDTTDGPQTFSVWNSGNAVLIGSGVLSDTTDFTLFAGSGTPPDCTPSGFSLAPGAECNVNIEFTPEQGGVLDGTFTLTDNALSASAPSYATQTISLSGTGIQPGTALTSSANPSTLGAVTFTATVTVSGGATPTGTVGFYDASGATLLATRTLSGGVATYTTSSLLVGTYHIVAKYSGSGTDPASESAVLVQKVQYGTTTTLTSSANPSTAGEAVIFTATVTPSGGATPTGTVGFYDASGGTLLATAALNDGVATYMTSLLLVGTYHIVAKYSGSGANVPSQSALLVQVVNP